MSLGDILREKAKTAAAYEEERKKKELEYAKSEQLKEAIFVTAYFDSAAEKLTQTITSGSYFDGEIARIAGDGSKEEGIVKRLLGLNGMLSTTCESKEHLYYPQWCIFKKWAETEGLNVHFQLHESRDCNIDGYANSYWYTLNAKIKE